MKKIILVFVTFFLYSLNSFGQGDPSAAMDVQSPTNSTSFLIPRMTTVQRDVIASPANSLLIYNIDDSCFNYYKGTRWVNLCDPTSECPSGFLSVDDQFSIEITERSADNWYNAAKICRDLGARLCFQDEWYYACQSSIPLLNMTDNFEWINASGNTGGSTKQIGFPDCTTTSNGNSLTVNIAFRCCCGK